MSLRTAILLLPLAIIIACSNGQTMNMSSFLTNSAHSGFMMPNSLKAAPAAPAATRTANKMKLRVGVSGVMRCSNGGCGGGGNGICREIEHECPRKPYQFAGLFSAPLTCATPVYNNPLTHTISCPPGFKPLCANSDQIYYSAAGFCDGNCLSQVYQCVSSGGYGSDEKHGPFECAVANFGGIFLKCGIPEWLIEKLLLMNGLFELTETRTVNGFTSSINNMRGKCGEGYEKVKFLIGGQDAIPTDTATLDCPLEDIAACLLIACFQPNPKGQFGGMFALSYIKDCVVGNPAADYKAQCPKDFVPVLLTSAVSAYLKSGDLTPCPIAIYYCIHKCLLPKGPPGPKGLTGEKGHPGHPGPPGAPGKCDDHRHSNEIKQLRELVMLLATKDKKMGKKHHSHSSSKSKSSKSSRRRHRHRRNRRRHRKSSSSHH